MEAIMEKVIRLYQRIMKKGDGCDYKIDRTDLDHLLSLDTSHLSDSSEEQDIANAE
jgi:hypothetical protein